MRKKTLGTKHADHEPPERLGWWSFVETTEDTTGIYFTSRLTAEHSAWTVSKSLARPLWWYKAYISWATRASGMMILRCMNGRYYRYLLHIEANCWAKGLECFEESGSAVVVIKAYISWATKAAGMMNGRYDRQLTHFEDGILTLTGPAWAKDLIASRCYYYLWNGHLTHYWELVSLALPRFRQLPGLIYIYRSSRGFQRSQKIIVTQWMTLNKKTNMQTIHDEPSLQSTDKTVDYVTDNLKIIKKTKEFADKETFSL